MLSGGCGAAVRVAGSLLALACSPLVGVCALGAQAGPGPGPSANPPPGAEAQALPPAPDDGAPVAVDVAAEGAAPDGGASGEVGAVGERATGTDRHRWEVYVGLGAGSSVCGDDPDCPVEGGVSFALGGAYRFHPHWAIGLELGGWSFAVNESWRGQLDADIDASEVSFGTAYVLPVMRWYWFERGIDPYLLAGIGAGTLTGHVENSRGATYDVSIAGLGYHLGIGVEWQLTDLLRLGLQYQAYLHVGGEICERVDGGAEQCRAARAKGELDPDTDMPREDREGIALPYRLNVVCSFTFG